MKLKKIIENIEDNKLVSIEFNIETEGLSENQNQILVVGSAENSFAELRGLNESEKRKNAYTDMVAKVQDNVSKIKAKEDEEKAKVKKVKEVKEGDIKDYK